MAPRPGRAAGSPRIAALRSAIATYLAQARGVACAAEDVIVTAGIRQSLRLLAELLLDPGETALVEDPGFPGIAQALASAGLRPVPVRWAWVGCRHPARPPGARRAARRGDAGRTITPSGHTMSLENRLDLLAWAEASGGLDRRG